MTTSDGLIDLSLAEFARAAAAPTPVPASGCVAAAVGALGAGLASMALGSTRGEGRTERAARATAAELAQLMEGLLARVELDAEAYAQFRAARAGDGSLEAALERAIAVPREIAEQAVAALERLAAGKDGLRPRLYSEGFTAAAALLASVEGATFTARANLAELPDGGARQAGELEALRARAEDLARTVRTHVGCAAP
jgi:formiminotetrahydrofolate cyclodeaminase